MAKQHSYSIDLNWTGNLGKGTASYDSYSRDYEISLLDKPVIEGSSDPAFRGNPEKYNPEEMLLMSIASCHMLWYLHLCSASGITVVSYSDSPKAIMVEDKDGGGRFSEVTLFPNVTIIESNQLENALKLHAEANKKCFIANSCNFPIRHVPAIQIVEESR